MGDAIGDDVVSGLVREAFGILATTGAPLLVLLFATGLVMGVLQAATQVNDPAVGFLPRLVIGLGVVWLFGGSAVEQLARFFASALWRAAGAP